MDNMQPRIKEKYLTEIIPELKEKLSMNNVMSLPKLLKVTLNMGLSEAVADTKVIQSASNDLASIAGQLPVVTKAWNAMVSESVHENGFLGWLQSTGKEPKDGQPLSYDKQPDFEDYGLGCFLLAGSEMYRLEY